MLAYRKKTSNTATEGTARCENCETLFPMTPAELENQDRMVYYEEVPTADQDSEYVNLTETEKQLNTLMDLDNCSFVLPCGCIQKLENIHFLEDGETIDSDDAVTWICGNCKMEYSSEDWSDPRRSAGNCCGA